MLRWQKRRNNMAKKYPYTVTLALPDGRRKYYRGATKKEAEEKRDKDKALLGGGVNLADKSTFQEVAELWFYLFKEDQLHTKSKETIKGTLARHVYPMRGRKKIRDIKPADIFALMKSVSSKSNSLQKKVLQYVKSIFAFAMDNDLILKEPRPKRWRRSPMNRALPFWRRSAGPGPISSSSCCFTPDCGEAKRSV